MKIAILTAFRHMPISYSLVGDVRDQIKTLKKYGHDVVFFAQEGCTGEGIECEMRAVFPHFKLEKNVVNQEIKKELIDLLEKHLQEFDVAITHDLMYLQMYITYREAIKEANLPKIKWIHWAHSAIGDKLDLKMPHAKYVYMNYKDVDRFAKHIGVKVNDVRVVFNHKDPRIFFDWHPITWEIADKIDLFNRDIMQTYPMCTTRMDAKGIDNVIRVFGKLKQLGNKVLLIIPNANARKRKEEIKQKIAFAKVQGLNEDEFVFTSELNPEWVGQVPREVVRDLMLISNVFVFPTLSEVCSNVLLEASMTKQLIVLNKDFPPLFDFGEEGRTCLGYHFGSLLIPGYKYKTEEGFLYIAKVIHQHLKQSKENQQFRKILQSCNIDAIYKNQLDPILYEEY